jgi:uncharacterized membrane protein
MKTMNSFNKLLMLFMLFVALLISFRIFYSGSIRYIFMSWNIFLAWIPYALSAYFVVYQQKQPWKRAFLFCSWFLFFPNALNIVTDLVHLRTESTMPWWYDTILIFSSAFIGLLMAIVSLLRAESFLSNMLPKKAILFLMPMILFISSFGVYLGRFQRWNSWDVVGNPLSLGYDIAAKIFNPFDHYKVWAITILFTVIYSLVFYFIKLMPRVVAEIKDAGQ